MENNGKGSKEKNTETLVFKGDRMSGETVGGSIRINGDEGTRVKMKY